MKPRANQSNLDTSETGIASSSLGTPVASNLGVAFPLERKIVKTHTAGIYRKTHVHTQQELIGLLENRAQQIDAG